MDFPLSAKATDKASGDQIDCQIWKASPAYVANEGKQTVWSEWHYAEDDEEADWDWEAIIQECLVLRSRYELYSCWVGETLHGLMVVDLAGMAIGNQKHIVVDYLVSNPANRPKERGLKYIGTALVVLAAKRSIELGMQGRVFLASLGKSEPFYANLGFERLDTKSSEGYNEYVLDAEAAQELLKLACQKGIICL